MKPFATSLLSVFGLLATQTNAMDLDQQRTLPVPDAETVIEYNFSTRRCSNRQKNRPRFGQTSKCDASCEGDDDDTIGCSWSYPKGDPLKGKSEEAACRCNQREYKYKKPIHKNKKCEKAGNFCEEDETCHLSWPFYNREPTKEDKQFRCKGPLSDDSVETDTDSPDEDVDPIMIEIRYCQQPDFNDNLLCMHNQARALHEDTDPLTLDQDEIMKAQDWADYMAEEGIYGFSEGGSGENVSVYAGPKGRVGFPARRWYRGIFNYVREDPQSVPNENWGDFATMVWRESTLLGCGEAEGKCPDFYPDEETCNYTVCRYNPPANILGEDLDENVKPQIPQTEDAQSTL